MSKNKNKKQKQSVSQAVPIAIVGIGAIFPDAKDTETFWSNIKNGVDSIKDVPESHWRPEDYFDEDPKSPDHVYAKKGGFLPPIDFNPMEYGILPNALEAVDTSQMLGLVAVDQALKDAGYTADKEFDRDKVSVIIGITGTLELVIPLGARLGHPRWREALKDAGVDDAVAEDAMQRISDSYVKWQENSFPGLLGNVVAGRISKHFNFGGTNCVCDAACGSSLSALNLAALELAAGKADMVISGGIDTFNDIFMYSCFSKTPALSPSGHARPYASDSDGTTLGEGLGIVVLKRLVDAERDGDKIYAVIKGIGASSDGRGTAIYEPNAAGQQKALKRAYEQGGISPDTIEMIEGHGTGTKVGDAVEVTALREVFGEAQSPWCAIGSVKSQIGHTKAAAGAAGLIKAALSLYNKTLPPTIKVKNPQSGVTEEKTPFYVNTEARPWPASKDHPRRAGVSALGFGGANFHCLLEEYKSSKAEPDWKGDVQIVAFSAADERGIESALEKFPASDNWNELRIAADLSRIEFDASLSCRLLMVMEKDGSAPASQIKSALSMLKSRSGEKSWSTPDGVFFAAGEQAGDLAMLFPGQGAQYTGMLKDLAVQFPQFLESLEEADGAFMSAGDEGKERLSTLIYPHPAFDEKTKEENEEKLRSTEVAQPALGAVSLGAKRVLESFGITAQAFAGHSYGELPALSAGGYFDSSDLHTLSGLRGELMAEGEGDRGSMLAVSAPLADIEEFIKKEGLSLVLANRNTPGQGVLSGATAEIEKAAALFKDQDIRCKQLLVSAAFHSELVADAAGPFAERLKEISFKNPTATVYSNTTGKAYPKVPVKAQELLASQLASPVDFVSEIENIYKSGVRIFLETGPGARLSGMVKAILGDREYQTISIDSSNGKRSGINDLARALAQLTVLGCELKLDLWDKGYAERNRKPEGKKPGMTVQLTGANYFKAPEKRPAVTSKQAALPSLAPTAVPPVQLSGEPGETLSISTKSSEITLPPNSGSMQQALFMTKQSMQAMQRLQEETSRLHRQFLEGQEKATQSLLSLVDQQRRLFQGLPLAVADADTQKINMAKQVPSSAHAPVIPEAIQPAPVAAPVRATAPTQIIDSGKVSAALLGVIAEKTGYPVDMLELGMTLDTDLGIDSIKRVEILSALQERLPEAPAVRPEDLGSLQTLGQIVDFLNAGMRGVVSAPAAQAEPPAIDSAKVSEALLEVIAEKTGYPVDMLELEMTLDTDLGIDSIKRVEILSALQERLPEAPVVRPEDLGSLQTLGQIVDFLNVGMRGAVSAPAAQIAPPAIDSAKVSEALLEVIAEKTGYPVDMLELEMTLDTDLGIDSIKRVEILSALQERLPGAPAIKPEHLSTLQTLGQIVDFLTSVAGAGSIVASPTSKEDASKPAAGIERKVLKVVPFKPKNDRNSLVLPEGSKVWVVEEGSELTDKICHHLETLKLEPIKIKTTNFDKLAAPDELAGLIIFSPSKGTDDLFLQRAFSIMQMAGPALNRAANKGGAFFTSISRLNGSFGLSTGNEQTADPLSGGLAGLSKTAGHEWQKVRCKAIDIAQNLGDTARAAGRIIEEALADGPVETGISSRGLVALKLSVTSLPEELPSAPLSEGDLIVVSGGARGVTAEVALSIARSGRSTMLLLGRTSLPETEPTWITGLSGEGEIKKAIIDNAGSPLKPVDVQRQFDVVKANREIRNTIKRIEAAGGKALYRSVDLRDAKAVKKVIEEARSDYGPVRGFIHGAGVLADRLIKDKTLDQFEMVYSTKVEGLRSLLDAVKEDELRFMVMFSSSTGRFGRTGQVDYAVANEVLNKMAQQQAILRPDCRVLSLNWGPWDGGMVTPALKKVFEEEGVAVIDLKAGADYLLKEIATPAGGPVELVILGGREEAEEEVQPETQQNIYVSKAFDLGLSIDEYPFLRSHVMDGKAVLPMAMMVEWMAHGAIHNNPGLRFHGFNDLRLLKGVALEEGQTHSLQVMTGKSIKSGGSHVVPVELSGKDEKGKEFIHARAKIVLAAKLPEGKEPAGQVELAEYSRSVEDIYKWDRLFHGSDFHSIREIEGYSEAGMTSLVRPAPLPSQWINQPLRNSWLADPLAMDSSFQMMILWSFERYKAGSLPVFAGRYRQYQERFPEKGAEIRIRVTDHSASKARADIDFIDPLSGALIARIEDYECVIDASLNESFQRNKLEKVA